MPFFAPKFCQKHLKIHVCSEGDIRSTLNERENSIASKVRRLHGTQTEEEKAAENAKRVKLQMGGGFNSILENAKKKNEQDKKETSFLEETVEVKKEVINDRISRLRNAALNDGASLPKTPPIPPTTPTPKKEITPKTTEVKEEINPVSSPSPSSKSVKEDNVKEVIKSTPSVKKSLDKLDKTYSENDLKKIVAEAVKMALTEAGVVKKTTTKVKAKKSSIKKGVVKKTTKKVVAKPATKKAAAKSSTTTKRAPIAKLAAKPATKKITVKSGSKNKTVVVKKSVASKKMLAKKKK
ncbi:hypothetical protein [Spiroplasma endosymbiont of Crioceris asparagi]|uniref:hypothetical protein n=1 Tax=Spiroplasma endosymbiont of Crioceris asparagi TaxID=3066286 RepID=UPI0030D50032